MIKKIKILTLFVSALFITEILAKQRVEILVDMNYPPFSFVEKTSGEVLGIYNKILKQAFDKMDGYKVKLKGIPWKRGKEYMKTASGFGLAPAFFHGHDWPYLFPYSMSFYTETIIVVCHKSVLKIHRPKWPEDYIGLKIGNIAGFDGWGGDKFHSLVTGVTDF